MSELEQRRVTREFQLFASRNFVKPKKCKNIDEVQFYIKELADKIEEMKEQADFIPNEAYIMLAEYNKLQNSMLYKEFIQNY